MGSKERRGPTPGVCLIEVSFKIGSTVQSVLNHFFLYVEFYRKKLYQMIHCQKENKAGSVFGHFLTSQELRVLKLLGFSILAIESQRHTCSLIRYNIRMVLNKTGPLYISGFSLIPKCL